MSLVCETIISEDELSQTQSHATNCDDEELDYEEEDIHNNKINNQLINDNNQNEDFINNCQQKDEEDDKDEGELEDDDDLEEGEVKEDDDSDDGKTNLTNRKRIMAPESSDNRVNNNNSNTNNSNNNAANSVCRFFGRGQCTWGNACRFVHPTGGMLKRLPPLPPMPPMPPMPPHLPLHPPNRNRPHRDFYENPSIHGPHPPQNQSSGSESAWERGLKQAKEMIVRASRRKEEEIDFEDKRFNLGVEDDTSRHSRTSHNSRDSSNSPLDNRYDDDEYERRRRLAFESAPWNNDEPIRSAETYRDPWRRSKSPPSGPKFRRPIAGSRSGSKRSHSMSSISASGSDSSDFSGSEGSSFSESSASNLSERSGGRRRFNRKIMEKKKDLSQPTEQRLNKKGITNPNWTKTVEPNRDEREYDSWSESLSESESISSYYSGSNSDSDVSNDSDPKGKQRIPKRPLSNSKKDPKVGLTSQKRSGFDQSDGPPNKKNKFTARSGSANAPLSPLLSTKTAKIESTQTLTEKSEPPKKSPIKMTFMKKHSNLKKDNKLAAKLNGGRDNEVEPELIVEEEEDSLNMSVGLSPKLTSKSISSSSPVSQEALTPPQQPLQQTPSSSSSGGSSKHDKQSLSATVSRREELLQQLRAVEDAIARKRSKIN